MYKKLINFIVLVSPQLLVQVVDGGIFKRATSCILPSNPDHGTYDTNIPNGKPGDVSEYILVNVTCHQNYKVDGLDSVYCYNGWWPDALPTCVSGQPLDVSPQPQTALVVDDGDSNSSEDNNCVLPPYPLHGTYISNIANAKPGDIQEYLHINITCHQGYRLEGSATIFCFNGWWPEKMPKCVSSALSIATADDNYPDRQQNGDKCILPEYSAQTTYTTNEPGAKPGEAYDIVVLNLTCQEDYILNGPNLVFCASGQWQGKIPRCVPRCQLQPHTSVAYLCQTAEDLLKGIGSRACNEYEPSGIWAKPYCKPHYRAISTLSYNECRNGRWTRDLQKCIPECGTLNPQGTQLVINGSVAKLGEIPWHAAIYKKTTSSVELVCGGSLVSNNIVISAAHCFWEGGLVASQLPASKFVVALGKLYRDPDNKMEQAQWSNVEALRIPTHYRHSSANFQADIAVVELSTAIEYQRHIRPVCVDFEPDFEERQLEKGNKGKVPGWGLTSENDARPSDDLRVIDLPYVPTETCFNDSPTSFTGFITVDKFCAGYFNEGKGGVCRGDSGGGLAFPAIDKHMRRYFLRGVVSTTPVSSNECNPNTYTTFTRLQKYEDFIKQHWLD